MAKKYLLGGMAGLLLGITGSAMAQSVQDIWRPNPLFESLPVGVSYSQREYDMTILYGKLEGLADQVQRLTELESAVFQKCGR